MGSFGNMMNRRAALSLIAGATLAPTAMAQDAALLGQVSAYLNQLQRVRGRFSQTNSDGSKSSGIYYWQRPGRIRFEYGASGAMVISDGNNITVFDPKSNGEPASYPLRLTPLRLLLKKTVDLNQRNLVTDTSSGRGITTVTLRDPKRPKDGYMVLRLRNRPATLEQWTVVEKNGQKTTIKLDSLEKVERHELRLFDLTLAKREFAKSR